MKKNSYYTIYKWFVIVLSIITFLSCIVSENENGYRMIAILPAAYLVLFIVNRPLHYYSRNYIGMLMINVVMFIKYIITTLLIVTTGDYYLPSAYRGYIGESSNDQAIIILLAEMVSIFLIINFLAPFIYRKKERKEKKEKAEAGRGYDFGKSTVFYVVLVIGIVAFFLKPDVFMPKQLLYMGDDFELGEQEMILTIISHVFKLTVISFFMDKIIRKYMKSKNITLIFIAYALVLLLCLLNTGRSRTLMIIPLLLFVLITSNIFNKKVGVAILVIVASVLSINLAAVSDFKFSWQKEEKTVFERVLNTGDSIQEYTSSIRPVAAAIEVNHYYSGEVGLRTFLNDTFGSIPVINHYVNKKDRYNVYYNYYILEKEQTTKIAPLTGYSVAYFGKFGCFIISSFFIILLMVFDKNKNSYKTEGNFLIIYNSYYLLFILADSIFCSYQSVIGRIFTLYVPIKLIEIAMRISLGKKERKHVE